MSIYCTYLTVYKGNKLPPFYIGYTSVHKIAKGYRGTVSSKVYRKIWRDELKNHPELFFTKILSLHQTKQEALKKEYDILTTLQAYKNPLYINRNCGGKTFYAPWEDKKYRDRMLSTISKTHEAGKMWTEERRKEQSSVMKKINENRTPESRRAANLLNFDVDHYKKMSLAASNNPDVLEIRSKNMTSLNSVKKKCQFCDFESNPGLVARHIKNKH